MFAFFAELLNLGTGDDVASCSPMTFLLWKIIMDSSVTETKIVIKRITWKGLIKNTILLHLTMKNSQQWFFTVSIQQIVLHLKEGPHLSTFCPVINSTMKSGPIWTKFWMHDKKSAKVKFSSFKKIPPKSSSNGGNRFQIQIVRKRSTLYSRMLINPAIPSILLKIKKNAKVKL